MEIKDNEKTTATVKGTNGETNPDGTAEAAPLFEATWEKTGDGTEMTVAEDKMSAEFKSIDLGEGAEPKVDVVTFKAKSKADLADFDLVATGNITNSNPPATGVELTFAPAVPK